MHDTRADNNSLSVERFNSRYSFNPSEANRLTSIRDNLMHSLFKRNVEDIFMAGYLTAVVTFIYLWFVPRIERERNIYLHIDELMYR